MLMQYTKGFYLSWWGLKRRCNNPAYSGYKNYGGRGISYDPAWEKFSNFYSDMHEGWFEGATLDRADVNGNYCKNNCRWIKKEEQSTVGRLRNRTDNTSGVRGVEKLGNTWRVLVRERGLPARQAKKILLYKGPSFEVACEIRKQWEEQNKGLYS